MTEKYILDTNIYIEAYKGYYHPDIVPVYWDILKSLGDKDSIISPKQVLNEIKIQNKPQASDGSNMEDRFLFDWSRSKENSCFLRKDLHDIEIFFRKVQEAYLIVKEKNSIIIRKKNKGFKWPRKEPVSDPDMFVIATVLFYKQHFPSHNYFLITKEGNDNPPKQFKPAKIPHICTELGIEWMDDFAFLRKLGIAFDSTNFI